MTREIFQVAQYETAGNLGLGGGFFQIVLLTPLLTLQGMGLRFQLVQEAHEGRRRS